MTSTNKEPYTLKFVEGIYHVLKCLLTNKMPNHKKMEAFLALIPEAEHKHIAGLDPRNITGCKNFAIVCAFLGIQTTGDTFETRCVANLLKAIHDSFERTYCLECDKFKKIVTKGLCEDCEFENELRERFIQQIRTNNP